MNNEYSQLENPCDRIYIYFTFLQTHLFAEREGFQLSRAYYKHIGRIRVGRLTRKDLQRCSKIT